MYKKLFNLHDFLREAPHILPAALKLQFEGTKECT